MLQYGTSGTQQLYHQLLRTAYELADRTEATRKYRTGTGYMHGKYYSFQQIPPHSYQEICLSLEAFRAESRNGSDDSHGRRRRSETVNKLYIEHEKYVTELFDIIWISTHWTDKSMGCKFHIGITARIPANDVAVNGSCS